jgi:putative tryptophan/tyrosine transport system substrate-binding protein
MRPAGRLYVGQRGPWWILLCVCLGWLFTPGGGVCAEPATKDPFRIFLLLYRGVTEAERGFMDAFAEHGIGVEFTLRDCDEDPRRLQSFIEEARAARPDLIYTFGTTVTRAVVGLEDNPGIQDIPIVFAIVADPVGAGLVPSLAGSGRNLTGASHLVPLPNQLAALRSVVQVQRVGVIYNPAEANSRLLVEQLTALAAEEHFELIRTPVDLDHLGADTPERLSALVEQLAEAKVDALYLPSDSFIISHAAIIIQQAHAVGIPTFSATETPIRQDHAFMGLVSRYYAVGQFAAYKAEQILLQGRDPGSIPVETLNRFSLVINLKAARALRVFPPVGVFRFAEVVERLR